MSRFFSTILFSLFLLFQTTSIAEEDTAPTETNIEEPEVQSDPQEGGEEVEPTEEVSEAEKEAHAAEEAELREAGMGEEALLE